MAVLCPGSLWSRPCTNAPHGTRKLSLQDESGQGVERRLIRKLDYLRGKKKECHKAWLLHKPALFETVIHFVCLSELPAAPTSVGPFAEAHTIGPEEKGKASHRDLIFRMQSLAHH